LPPCFTTLCPPLGLVAVIVPQLELNGCIGIFDAICEFLEIFEIFEIFCDVYKETIKFRAVPYPNLDKTVEAFRMMEAVKEWQTWCLKTPEIEILRSLLEAKTSPKQNEWFEVFDSESEWGKEVKNSEEKTLDDYESGNWIGKKMGADGRLNGLGTTIKISDISSKYRKIFVKIGIWNGSKLDGLFIHIAEDLKDLKDLKKLADRVKDPNTTVKFQLWNDNCYQTKRRAKRGEAWWQVDNDPNLYIADAEAFRRTLVDPATFE
jgi:hypothetical protein